MNVGEHLSSGFPRAKIGNLEGKELDFILKEKAQDV